MFNAKIFANRVKAVRTQKNISQAELAKIAGVSAATISSYENPNGAKVPTLDKAAAIASHLGVTLDYLCGEDTAAASIVDFDLDLYLRSLIIVLSETSTAFTKKQNSLEDALGKINIYHPEIVSFITKFLDLLNVFRSGTLSQDLYITCVEKLISDVNERYIIDYSTFMIDMESCNLMSTIDTIYDANNLRAGKYKVDLIYGFRENAPSREAEIFISNADVKKYMEVKKNAHNNPPKE